PIQAKKDLTDRYQFTNDPRGLQSNAAYASMVQSVDDATGRVLDTLNELDLDENTLVMFTSDNGGLLPKTNNSPLRDGKGSPYEGGIRVPWIMRWPGKVEPGSTCDEPIITCDIKPTVLDAVGAKSIDPQPMDGISLVPLITDAGVTSLDRSLFWHFPHYREEAWTPYAIIRKGSMKLIYWFESTDLELYDLRVDLAETQNLAASSPHVAKALEGDLTEWIKSVGGKVPRAKPSTPVNSAIRERMERFVVDQEVAGVTTLVATPEEILHFDCTGWADVAQREPLREGALFCIASMTKPITSTAVMMLHDEGKLSVDDPITKYLPEFGAFQLADGTEAEVTIEQMLTHTSGMKELSAEQQAQCTTLAELIPKYAGQSLKFSPGSRWAYSQTSINAAARIVEVVSGMTFPDFLDRRLFRPLCMYDTTFYPNDSQATRWAKAYRKTEAGVLEEGTLRLLEGKNLTSRDRYPKASGGLFSTARDYTRFCQMILNGGEFDGVRYLSKQAIVQMTTLRTGDMKAGFTPGTGWGLGWCVVREPRGVAAPLSAGSFGHGGAYGTQAWIDPITRRIYVLMVQRLNFPNSDKSIVRREFLRLATQ
ncbi:MAG: serine hydrolase, partial [Planctomycetota bacterium]